MRTGVCYYPEHWPETEWATDARRMRDLGIKVVRIGEFAWSRLEPNDGNYNLEWLQRSLDILGDAGLEVVLGTPTATPPKWLVDKLPDMLACDEHGHPRRFGSRRHYCFSSKSYQQECARIVRLLAERFGQHPAIIAWQIDNEYGCHSTVLSYSEAAKNGFQHWCSKRYGSVEQLNTLWGNVFWSMEYSAFTEIDLPCGSVTETNPAHRMAFWRYSSEQVREFNQRQTTILRKLSPGRDLIHNYMGNFVEFDHYDVAQDLDIASWDSYPLGFLDRDSADPAELQSWYRTGHPDTSAFHHDLYRGVGKGRWWVMEQQPGPVNWAPHNPSPLEGMVRLWGWEAFAHGAEVVSYFRWRQMPVAQEQTHTGLCLPDGQYDTAAREVKALSMEIESLQAIAAQSISTAPAAATKTAPVALLFDYAADQMQRILCSGGDQNDPLQYTQALYRACRRCGVDIDILPIDAELSDYRAIFVSNQIIEKTNLTDSLLELNATIVLFPGSGSRTAECAFPDNLGAGDFRRLIDVQVTRSETLPPGIELIAETSDGQFRSHHWRERIHSDLQAHGSFADGWGFHYQSGNIHYLNAKLVTQDLERFVHERLLEAGVKINTCTSGLRFRTLGNLQFAFNYGPGSTTLQPAQGPNNGQYLIGNNSLDVGDLAVWEIATD